MLEVRIEFEEPLSEGAVKNIVDLFDRCNYVRLEDSEQREGKPSDYPQKLDDGSEFIRGIDGQECRFFTKLIISKGRQTLTVDRVDTADRIYRFLEEQKIPYRRPVI